MFELLVFALYFTLLAGLYYGYARRGIEAFDRKQRLLLWRLGLFGWLLITGVLASQGQFTDFSGIPPKIIWVIFFPLLAAFALGLGPAVLPALDGLPQFSILLLQTFRVPVEWILWTLASEGRIPSLMTFDGRNLDVFSGFTAPLVAYAAYRNPRSSQSLVVAWNIVGLCLLTNVMIHGILSSPVRFQVFFTQPPNQIIGTFPFLWLPAFVVQVAYFLHIISLRKAIWRTNP